MSADPIRALAQALNTEKRISDQLAEGAAALFVEEDTTALRAALDAYYAHRGGPS